LWSFPTRDAVGAGGVEHLLLALPVRLKRTRLGLRISDRHCRGRLSDAERRRRIPKWMRDRVEYALIFRIWRWCHTTGVGGTTPTGTPADASSF